MAQETRVALQPDPLVASEAATSFPAPTTLAEYISAVEQLNSGRFLQEFREKTRQYLACTYGAPFFALATLAPDVLNGSDRALIFGGEVRPFAEDGGRWLSLYARALHYPGRLACAICTSVKPNLTRAPRSILAQPPQRLVARDWTRHLKETPEQPAALFLYPSNSLRDFAMTLEVLLACRYGGPVLIAFASQTDAVIFQKFIREHGFDVGNSLNFPMSSGTPQALVPGAWWLLARAPAAGAITTPKPDLVETLKTALVAHGVAMDLSSMKEPDSGNALAYGTRGAARVAGQEVNNAVFLSTRSGIDITSGRVFSRAAPFTEDEGDGYAWEDDRFDPALLSLFPEHNANQSADDRHYQVVTWLGRVVAGTEAPREMAHDDEAQSEARVDTTEAGDQDGATARSMSAQTVPADTRAASPAAAPSGTDGSSGTARVRALRSRLSRSAGAINVLATAARLGRPDSPSDGTFEAARELILTWVRNKGFPIYAEAGNAHVETPNGEVSVETDAERVWALRFDDRKQMEAGAFWRVELALIRTRNHPAVGLRLYQVRRTAEAPPPVSGVPKVMATIANELGLYDAGMELSSRAASLTGRAGAETLLRMLLNGARQRPIIAISNGQRLSMSPPAERLAERLVAAAHVVVVDDVVSDTLIRHVGRERSVFGNAIRLYRPGFSEQDDPFKHRIWTYNGNHFSPRVADDISEEALALSLEVGDFEQRVPSFVTIRNEVSEATLKRLLKRTEMVASTAEEERARQEEVRAQLEAELTTGRNRLEEVEQENKNLLEELDSTTRERDDALDEIRRLRHRLSELREVRYREEVESRSESEVLYPDSWDALESWVEETCEGRVVLLPPAIKAAKESPFRDIPLAYKSLEFLARHYVPLRTRREGDDEVRRLYEQALADLGLECSPVGVALSDKRYKKDYRRLHDGREVVLDMHLKRGAGFDPATIFRLYFCYDAAQSRVIVGHLPSHLTNRKTHSG